MLGLSTVNVRSDVYDDFQYVRIGNDYYRAEFDSATPSIDFSNASTKVYSDGTSIWLFSSGDCFCCNEYYRK